MSIKGITLSATFEYESDADEAKGTPLATVFTLGPLDVFATSHIYDSQLDVGPQGNVVFHNNKASVETVRLGIKGWRNFKDDDGNDIAFATKEVILAGRKYTAVDDDLLACIPYPEVRAMADLIRQYSIVTVDEAKNSEGPA